MAFLLAVQAARAAGLVSCKHYSVVTFRSETEFRVGRPKNGYGRHLESSRDMH